MIEVTAPALGAHPFLRGMPAGELAVLASCASDVTLPARHRIFEEGGYDGRAAGLLVAVPALPLGVRCS